MEFIKQDTKILCVQNAKEIGYCQLVKQADSVYGLTFVYVDPAHRGHGIASQLVKAAVGHAKENNFKIVPICPYAVHEFKLHEDYKQVLFKK